MSDKPKHTPIPWKAEESFTGAVRRLFVTADGTDGFLPWSDADAELIVRAVNNHEKLVAALHRVWDYYDHGNLTDFKGVMRQLSETLDAVKGGAG